MHTGFGGETLEKGHFQDTGVDGATILKWIFKNRVSGLPWIDLA